MCHNNGRPPQIVSLYSGTVTKYSCGNLIKWLGKFVKHDIMLHKLNTNLCLQLEYFSNEYCPSWVTRTHVNIVTAAHTTVASQRTVCAHWIYFCSYVCLQSIYTLNNRHQTQSGFHLNSLWLPFCPQRDGTDVQHTLQKACSKTAWLNQELGARNNITLLAAIKCMGFLLGPPWCRNIFNSQMSLRLDAIQWHGLVITTGLYSKTSNNGPSEKQTTSVYSGLLTCPRLILP